MSRTLLLLVALLLLPVPAWALPDLDSVVKALQEGRHQQALAACQEIEQSGRASFGSLYNQGLALRNLGDLPRARASFERALLLNPHDLATRKRLREIDAELGPGVRAASTLGTPWWSANESELLLLLPGALLLGLVLTARLRGQRPAATPTLVLLLAGLGLIGMIVLTAPARERAVVIAKDAQLLPEPRPDKPGKTVPAGCLVDITGRSEHYIEIRTGAGDSGWLRSAQAQELTLPRKAQR
jgi:tetratricopeptide (TPR) repeat protein